MFGCFLHKFVAFRKNIVLNVRLEDDEMQGLDLVSHDDRGYDL